MQSKTNKKHWKKSSSNAFATETQTSSRFYIHNSTLNTPLFGAHSSRVLGILKWARLLLHQRADDYPLPWFLLTGQSARDQENFWASVLKDSLLFPGARRFFCSRGNVSASPWIQLLPTYETFEHICSIEFLRYLLHWYFIIYNLWYR